MGKTDMRLIDGHTVSNATDLFRDPKFDLAMPIETTLEGCQASFCSASA